MNLKSLIRKFFEKPTGKQEYTVRLPHLDNTIDPAVLRAIQENMEQTLELKGCKDFEVKEVNGKIIVSCKLDTENSLNPTDLSGRLVTAGLKKDRPRLNKTSSEFWYQHPLPKVEA